MAEGDSGGNTVSGYVQLAVVALVLLAGIYFAQAPERITVDPTETLSTATPPPEVTVFEPEPGSHSAYVSLTGTVGPHGVVSMSLATVGGRVVWVSPSMRFGGAFSAGEVLLRIDPSDYEMGVADGEAELRGAQAKLERVRLEGEAASAQYRRQNPGAEVPPLVANLPRIARAQAQVDEAVIDLEGRKLALSRTNFSLPFEGRITRVQVAVGQVLNGAMPFGMAYARDAMEIGAGIEKGNLDYLEPVLGRAATISADGDMFPGEVVRVSAMVDPTSRLARVFLKFADDVPLADLPLPGSFVAVQIEGPAFEDSYMLPSAAEQAGGHVWIVRNGELESVTPQVLRQAVTGWQNSPGWLVSAFDAADGVVVGSVFGAHEGMSVRVAQPVRN